MKCFVDMDNVLTDFDSAVKDIGAESGLMENAPEDAKNRMYKAIDEAGPEFWSLMHWAPEGKQLWSYLKPYNPVLLSSPGEFHYAEAGKQNWVSKNTPGTTLICDPEKFRYAEREAILIDDMKDNIGAWEEAGGVGILHTSLEDTKKQLEAIMKEPKMRATLADQIRRIAGIFSLQDFPKISRFLVNYDVAPAIKKVVLKAQSKDKITEADMNSVRDSLKQIPDLKEREMFQYIILKPIQAYLGKIIPTTEDNRKREEHIKELEQRATEKGREEKGIRDIRQKMKDTLTKGAPTTQVTPRSPHSERVTSICRCLASTLQKA